jgi:hypothetical protein
MSPILRANLDEIVRPYMVRPLWPETNTGSVIGPKTPLFGRLMGTLSPSRRQIR